MSMCSSPTLYIPLSVCVFVLKQNYFMAFALGKHTDTMADNQRRWVSALALGKLCNRTPQKALQSGNMEEENREPSNFPAFGHAFCLDTGAEID